MASNDSGVEISNDSNDIVLSNPPIGLPNVFLHDNHLEVEIEIKLKHLSNNDERISKQVQSVDNNCSQSYLPPRRNEFKMRSCAKDSYKRNERSIYHFLSLSRERKLRIAASTRNVELLTKLLESGTDPNCSDEHKRSSLHLAACRGYTDIVSQLLKYGANPNIIDSLGNTPLHLAVISASSNNFNLVVRILLNGGANVHLLDRTGKNPLELAKSKLRLMRTRCTNPTKENLKILEDMCLLIAFILKHVCKQKKDIDQMSAVEERLKNLNTNDQVVSEADCLLESVERLSISK